MNDIGKTWVLQESTYTIENGNPVILLFSRNYYDKYETICHRISDFSPYFYCPKDEIDVELPPNCHYDDTVVIDALGREVVKVIMDIPSRVATVRDSYSFTDMSDFLFDKRFLVDYKIKYAYRFDGMHPYPVDVPEILDPRVLFFDIEVLSPAGIMPLPLGSDYEVVSIQVMDSYTQEIFIFTYKVPQTNQIGHIACKSEKELFKVFIEYIKQINPDVMTAWNGDQYDLPYLIRRSWKIGVNVNSFGRQGMCRCDFNPNDGRFNLRVPARSTLDMLAAFKKFTSGMAQRESYALKSVISDSELLDKRDKDGDIITKYAFSYKDLGSIMEKIFNEERWVEFIEYCRNDVIALNNINKAVNLFNFYENIRFISGCKLNDVLFNSKIIEMIICHEGIRPMPRKRGGISEPFEGAVVISPSVGISEWAGTYDLASLYPTILVAFQKSPDIDKIVLKTLEKTMSMREDLRARCKKDPDNIMLENQQMAIKFLNNSYFGVLSLQSFRLYNKEIAEFITSTGRDLNRYLQSIAKENNYVVVGGDTDAVIISPIDTIEIGLKMELLFNQRLHEWSIEHGCVVDFKLKFEKLYRRLLFKSDKNGKGVKKKYCGFLIWEEGRDCSELNYKGLELKRSDQAELTRECLRYFLEKLLIDGDPDAAVSRVKQAYTDIRDGNINIFDISLPKAVRSVKYANDNAWVRGINTAKERYNYLIQEGAKPRLIYLKNGEICIDEDFDTSLITNLIDYNTMADKVIKNKMESYIWSIGYSWDTIVHGQTNLMNFL